MKLFFRYRLPNRSLPRARLLLYPDTVSCTHTEEGEEMLLA